MDRKNKVWLIVLIALLILAMSGVVIFRNQLTDSQAQTNAANVQLAESQAEATDLQTNLETAQSALLEAQTQIEALAADLAAEQEKSAALENVPAEFEAKVAELEAALAAANIRIEEISAQAAAVETPAPTAEAAAETPAGEAETAADAVETPAGEAETAADAAEAPAGEAADKADSKEVVAHVTKTTQWLNAPGEEGQTIAELDKGDELHYMNQSTTDALNKEWLCVELNGQTGWIAAECAELQPAATSAETVGQPAGSEEIAANVDAMNQQLTTIVDSGATDEEKLSEIAALESQLSDTLQNLTQVSNALMAQSAALTDAESALTEAEAELKTKQAELETANAAVADLEARIAELSAQTEEETAARTELEAQLTAAQETYAALEAELTAAQETYAALEAELTATKETCSDLAAELTTARAEYEKHIAEINAYLLSRDLIDGEAHVATSTASEISVAADGMTAAFDFTNTSISGNAVVLTIEKDGVELYRSEPIAPGESIGEIAFADALSAGAHEAFAVTTVYNEDGSVQLSSRVPVALNVAE